MQEKQLLTLIGSQLSAGLEKQGVTAAIKYNVKPATTDTEPTLYLVIESQKRYGHLQRSDIVKADEIEHIERQLYESLIKITGQVIREADGSNDSSPPLSSLDLTNLAAYILQTDEARSTLREKSIGVMRVQDISHLFYSDDEPSSKNQLNAFFNLTINHEEVVTTASPTTQSFEFRKYKV